MSFTDNRITCKGLIKDAGIQWLYEVCGETVAQTVRRSRTKTSATKGSFEYQVDEGDLVGYVGSNMENAIWEEFGTGDFAIHGDGRKGYWVFVDDGTPSSGKPKGGKSYTLEEAKKIVAIMRSKKLNAYYTHGKTPTQAFTKAYNENKSKFEKRANQIMQELSGE